jgi:hypothetical protein
MGRLPQNHTGKTLSDFTDADRMDSWAKDAITLPVEAGIVEGCWENKVKNQNNIY